MPDPHRKSSEQHMRDGTWRADRHSRPREVAGRPTSAPAAPRSLNAAGKALWRRYCGVLVKGHVYDEADYDAVLGLVRLRQVCDNLQLEVDRLEKSGDWVLVTDKGYQYANPVLAAHRAAHESLRKALAELGLSPVARTRLPSRTAEQAEQALDEELGESPRQRALRVVGGQDDDA